MKRPILALLALCITICNYIAKPTHADAPRPLLIEVTAAKPSIGLGEPIIVKYKFINTENRRVNIYMGKNKEPWLNMQMRDASGHSVPALIDPKPTVGGISVAGTAVEPDGQQEGYIVVSRKFQPTAPGQYRLRLSAHLSYTWDDLSGEKAIDDQRFSLTITITNKNPIQLHTVAESLRQTVLHDPNVANYQFATKALFSMHDPDVLPVWRELATDPSLDPWKALDVARELTRVGSASAADLLAAMQVVAPERWSQTGYSPLDALESMRQGTNPSLDQHVDQLLTSNGVELRHIPVGEAN